MDYASRVRLPSLGRTSAGHFLVQREAGRAAPKSAAAADAALLRRLVNFHNSRRAARTRALRRAATNQAWRSADTRARPAKSAGKAC
jgi:hypothetical protein